MNKKSCGVIQWIIFWAMLPVAYGLGSSISVEGGCPQIDFAVAEIARTLDARGESAPILLRVDAAADLKPEGFRIDKTGQAMTVTGKDAAGAMYGGLDLAETIRSGGLACVESKTRNPYLPMRGIKFNIPLDARTPSYSDTCDAAQKNMPTVWDFDFWKEYIDTLARYHYNHVSLWSMHPFPSLVRVPQYPEVALDDVMRSRGPFEEYYNSEGRNWKGPEFALENLETIQSITLDEKIAFWRQVMAYGKSRNIDFYIITWNIFDYGIDGKYGITDDPRNTTTIDYFRQSVKTLILTYPDLAGIGVTAGENMAIEEEGVRTRLGVVERGEWMAKTYMAGTLDALEAQPGRRLRFIHRQHRAGVEATLERMKPLVDHPDIDFVFSFKYAQAHVYSATRQPYHADFVESIRGKVKTLWTLRNDDNYLYRWSAPDFVREFIKAIPHEVSQGYYYGHDGFINGREFTQLDHESPRQLEITKHGLQWMLWGRLAYDPDYSNERIIALLNARYPEVDGATLFDAWQKASMVYPRVTGFHWGHLDFMWYIEGTRGSRGYTRRMGATTDSGFHDVETFLSYPVHPHAGVQSIPDFVAGVQTDKQTPLDLADLIERDVDEAGRMVGSFGSVADKELRLTLDDIQIICAMGRYYADKIRGSTYVALARENRKAADKNKAIEALTRAADHYQRYVELATANHINEIWLNRVGILNFRNQIQYAIADIEIARAVEAD